MGEYEIPLDNLVILIFLLFFPISSISNWNSQGAVTTHAHTIS